MTQDRSYKAHPSFNPNWLIHNFLKGISLAAEVMIEEQERLDRALSGSLSHWCKLVDKHTANTISSQGLDRKSVSGEIKL